MVGKLLMNCLSVFDHFVGLRLNDKWLTKKTEYSVFSQSLNGAELGTQKVPLAFDPRATYIFINLLLRGLQGVTSSVRDLVLTVSRT